MSGNRRSGEDHPDAIRIQGITVSALRGFFRNLQAFRAYYETEHQDTIRDSAGHEWCLWDIEYLYEQRKRLSARQRQSIELCLFLNLTEEQAASCMGVSLTNPVAMYATDGLRKLVSLVQIEDAPLYEQDIA